MNKAPLSKIFLFIICNVILFFSCVTNNGNKQDTMEDISSIEDTENPSISSEPEVYIVIEEEPVIEKQNEVSIPIIEPEKQAEYSRSVSALKDEIIPPDVFENDKKDILQIIEDLAEIMVKKDYKRWVKYISPQSLEYWQNSNNLNTVSSRLPVKGITLKTMEDYFKMVFIPSRMNVTVDEIRYISSTSVKVVQVKGEQDIICYYFEKIKGEWMLILDTL